MKGLKQKNIEKSNGSFQTTALVYVLNGVRIKPCFSVSDITDHLPDYLNYLYELKVK